MAVKEASQLSPIVELGAAEGSNYTASSKSPPVGKRLLIYQQLSRTLVMRTVLDAIRSERNPMAKEKQPSLLVVALDFIIVQLPLACAYHHFAGSEFQRACHRSQRLVSIWKMPLRCFQFRCCRYGRPTQ